jgi:hypothetical protein
MAFLEKKQKNRLKLQTNNTFATNYNIRFPFVEGAKL